MKRLAWTAAICALLAVALGGCPRPPDGNGNGGTLTTAEKAAVQLVVEQIVAAAAIFGTISPLGDPQLDLDELDPLGVFGECPRVSYASNADTAVMQFDYTDGGCRGASTAQQTVIGEVNIDIELDTGDADFAFTQVRIDGNAITAMLDVDLGEEADGTQLTGTCSLDTADVGEFAGRIDVRLSSDSEVAFADADVEVSDGETTYDVDLTNVTVDPVGNVNFVPEGGSLTFTLEQSGSNVRVEVTFTSDSANSGTVRVEVGTASAVSYTIPGLVSTTD